MKKVCVFSDSFRCLGGTCQPHPHTQPQIGERCPIRCFVEIPENRKLQDMAGEPVEFVTFEEMQKMLADENLQQSQKAGASSCSMWKDTKWWRNQNEEVCRQNATSVASYAKNFSSGRWSFFGPGDEEKLYGSLIRKAERGGTLQQRFYDARFAMSEHLVSRCLTPLSTGVLKSLGGGRLSIH